MDACVDMTQPQGKLQSLNSAHEPPCPPYHIIHAVFGNAVGAFDFEPSPETNQGLQSYPWSAPDAIIPCKPRAKEASVKGQDPSASTGWTGWDSGSDLLRSKLQGQCQLLDTASGAFPPGTGQRAGTQAPRLQFLSQPGHSWAERSPPHHLTSLALKLLSENPHENHCQPTSQS